MSEKILISLSVVAVIAIIVFAVFMKSDSENANIANNANGVKIQKQDGPKKIDQERDFITGNKNAKVFIVEYSDLECPYCKVYNDSISEKLQEKYSSEVGFVYRHFPLNRHPSAFREATAVECAGQVGTFQQKVDFKKEIFATTNSDGQYLDEKLYISAEKVSLDAKKLQGCIETNQAVKDRVKEYYVEAIAAGVRGTPTVFGYSAKTGFVKLELDKDKIESFINSNR